MDNDFLKAFNQKQQDGTEDGTVSRPFMICPTLLTLAERQELAYKYQYLEESVEALALHYRVSPGKITEWLNDNHIERQTLETDEDIQEFEKYVNTVYKSLQVRILGLNALNTAKSWNALSVSEENLLASLENATRALSLQERPDSKVISTLAATHASLVSRHELIQKSLENAGDIIGALGKKDGWHIEVTHVENKSKTGTEEKEDED